SAATGVGKHEYAHGVIDRSSPKFDAHEVGRLFANVAGDPRMNEYVGSLRVDFKDQIEAFYRETWNKEWTAEEIEEFRREKLPHEQFADGVIYAWRYGKILPAIENEKVKEALAKALPLLKPAFTLFPQSTQDQHVKEAADKFYRIIDQAYPYYKELIPESLQK